MYRFSLLGLWLLPLLLLGCVSGSCSCAPPSLGFYIDSELKVTLVIPNGPAQHAGMQADDEVIDVRPAVTVPGVSNEPVPFTNLRAAEELTSHYLPSRCCGGGMAVRIRVQRNNEVLVLFMKAGYPSYGMSDTNQTVSPLSPISTPTPIPTRTPVPAEWHYF